MYRIIGIKYDSMETGEHHKLTEDELREFVVTSDVTNLYVKVDSDYSKWMNYSGLSGFNFEELQDYVSASLANQKIMRENKPLERSIYALFETIKQQVDSGEIALEAYDGNMLGVYAQALNMFVEQMGVVMKGHSLEEVAWVLPRVKKTGKNLSRIRKDFEKNMGPEEGNDLHV